MEETILIDEVELNQSKSHNIIRLLDIVFLFLGPSTGSILIGVATLRSTSFLTSAVIMLGS